MSKPEETDREKEPSKNDLRRLLAQLDVVGRQITALSAAVDAYLRELNK